MLAAVRPPLFSPVFGRMEPAMLAQWIMEDGLPVRMQLQLHKIIWDPQRRGV
jgi:7-carboxy-7-deazaguanine synthase